MTNLRTFLKKRGLTVEVLDLKKNSERNSLMISRVYNKWLSEQPKEVTENLPKHWPR